MLSVQQMKFELLLIRFSSHIVPGRRGYWNNYNSGGFICAEYAVLN